ncbi:MAG: hypothetical protein AAGD01_07660 [Acidobacteriota bacterium]
MDRPSAPRPRLQTFPLLLKLACALGLSLLLAAPAAAYVVVFKDGSRIQAQENYTVEGDQAIMVLINGTRVSYALDQIDRAATEKANEVSYGNAVLLNDGKEVSIDETTRLPRSRRETLSDLIRQRRAGIRRPEAQRRGEAVGAPGEASGQPETLATLATGVDDLRSLPRNAYPGNDLRQELLSAYRTRGVDQISLFEGVSSTRPLVEVIAGSEASVFRAVLITAGALLEIGGNNPEGISGIDLVILTPEGQHVGQFNMEPEMAQALNDKSIDIQRFFITHVQF